MKELKDSGLIAIEVPETSYSHYAEVAHDGETYYVGFLLNDKDPKDNHDHIIIDRDYDVVGYCTADEISFDTEPYTNATGLQSKEIFLQMLKANDVHFVNPYGDYATAHKRHILTGTWQEAESKVVEKILILKPL